METGQEAGFIENRQPLQGKMTSIETYISQPVFRLTSFVGHTRLDRFRPSNSHWRRTLKVGWPTSINDRVCSCEDGRFFLSHSSSILSRPICSNSSAWRASASAEAARAGLLKTSSAPAKSCFFQAWMSVGWTSNWPANSLTVRSPLRAARATRALNAAVWTFRLPAIAPPLLGHRSSLTGGPVFGVHYSPRLLVLSAAAAGRRRRARGSAASPWSPASLTAS